MPHTVGQVECLQLYLLRSGTASTDTPTIGQVQLFFDEVGRASVSFDGQPRQTVEEFLKKPVSHSRDQKWFVEEQGQATPLSRGALTFNAQYPHWIVKERRLVVKVFCLDFMIPNLKQWWQVRDFMPVLGLEVEEKAVCQTVTNFVYASVCGFVPKHGERSLWRKSCYGVHFKGAENLIEDRALPEGTLSSAGLIVALVSKAALGRPVSSRPRESILGYCWRA